MRDELLKTVQAHHDTIWNTCTEVWNYISAQKSECREKYFCVFLSQVNLEDIENIDIDHYFTKEAISLISNDIFQLENRIMENLIQQKMTEDEFYQNLWGKICDSTLLPNKKAQTAFLACLWLDFRIPYYQVGQGCRMESEEFVRLRDQILPAIKKANFILSIPMEQKTQRASLLMELADGIKDERERTVFWAFVISRLTKSNNSSSAKASDAAK